ncbi:MAG: tetratricopeptide repeat protein, partial [Anaerolineales bacterium]
MDDNVHLVLASRSKFGFPDLPLLIGRKQVKGIDISDLAFRAEEIKTYLELKLNQPVPLEDCRSLETRTEGWITGLLLFAYHGWGLLVDQGKALKVTGANIGDYFESQIYEKQAGWAQDLMLKTSLLDEFNAETCSVIFGEPEGNSWNDLIALLLENNLFVELIEDRGPWLRYHNLYKDFLQAKLAEDENKRWKLLELVYHHHLSQQDWEKAFAAARTIDDPRVMAETIEQASSPLFHAGRINLLAEWLEILPEEGYEVCPRLKILNGAITTIIENPISGFKIIDDLLNLDAIRATRDLYLKGLVSRATTYRLLGQYNKALSDIDTIFDSNTTQVEDLNILGEAYRESGLILNHLGKYTNSINSFRKSLDTYKQKQDYKNLALVHLDMGLVLMEHGDFDASMNHFQQALKTWTSQNNYPKLSILHNNLGILRLFTGDFPGSKEDLIIAISYAEKTSNIRMQAFSLA